MSCLSTAVQPQREHGVVVVTATPTRAESAFKGLLMLGLSLGELRELSARIDAHVDVEGDL